MARWRRCVSNSTDRLPSTLVHGDLHADNIARTGRGYVLSSTGRMRASAIPFVDFVMFVYNFGPTSNDPVVREATRSLLGRVSDVVPHAGAIAWYERAEPLATMHHAVAYRGVFDAIGSAEWSQFSWALPW